MRKAGEKLKMIESKEEETCEKKKVKEKRPEKSSVEKECRRTEKSRKVEKGGQKR